MSGPGAVQTLRMTAVPLTLYPTRAAEEAAPEITDPVMVELDQIMDSVACSCNAGDDNPPLITPDGSTESGS
jgi:hypothetical protein